MVPQQCDIFIAYIISATSCLVAGRKAPEVKSFFLVLAGNAFPGILVAF
jgi:hypothetical protein